MRLSKIYSSAADTERQATKYRILDVAERLFAQSGFELTSLRSLTAEAGVNLAAVNYHFGSKERLFEAVLQRAVGPINDERLVRLDALEAQGAPSLEALIDAFIRPPLRLLADDVHRGTLTPRLLGRCLASPDEEMRTLILRLFGTVLDRFVAAFGRALPHLSPPEVLWRVFFMLGVMVQTMSCGHHLKFVSHGACDPARREETVARAVTFIAAGMRAALPDDASAHAGAPRLETEP